MNKKEMQNEINELKKENKKLKEDREKCIGALEAQYSFKTTQDGLLNVFAIIRKQAIKEFAKKIKRRMYMKAMIQLKDDTGPDLRTDDMEKVINESLKEYGVEL